MTEVNIDIDWKRQKLGRMAEKCRRFTRRRCVQFIFVQHLWIDVVTMLKSRFHCMAYTFEHFFMD